MTLERQIEEKIQLVEDTLQRLARNRLPLITETAWRAMQKAIAESKLSRKDRLEFYGDFFVLLTGVRELREDWDKESCEL